MNEASAGLLVAILLLGAPVQSGSLDASPAQDARTREAVEEARRLVPDLGSTDGEAKERARARLEAIGKPALEVLERALYPEEPEVRYQAKELLKAIRWAVQVESRVAPVREGVRRTRERWAARDFKEIGEAAREAFRPLELAFVHYAPKLEVGDRLETDTEEGPRGFRPFDRTGGRRDLLTAEVVRALDKNDGLVFLGEAREPVDRSDVFNFTLPDRKGWSAWLVVQLVSRKDGRPAAASYRGERYRSRLLASSESRLVWGIDPDEADWASANFEAALAAQLRVSPQARGVRLDEVASGSLFHARGLLAGDLVRDLNGQAVRSLEDVRAILVSPASKGRTGLRLGLEREGRSLVLEYRVLPR